MATRDTGDFTAPNLAPGRYALEARQDGFQLYRQPEFTLNISLWRRFAITERTAMQFRWETFNLSNRANFNLPLTQVDVLAGGTISTARGARVHQLGLRLEF